LRFVVAARKAFVRESERTYLRGGMPPPNVIVEETGTKPLAVEAEA